MGIEKAQGSVTRTLEHKQPGLQMSNKGRMSVKPRILRKSSPPIYKIRPEEFLNLVQRLTGQSVPHPPPASEYFQMKTSTDAQKRSESGPRDSQSVGLSNRLAGYDDFQAPSTASRLVRPLPSPRVSDMNFLPMLSSSLFPR